MKVFLLAILILGPFQPQQYDVHRYTTMDDCMDNAMILLEAEIIPANWQVWCAEIEIYDGYAALEVQ